MACCTYTPWTLFEFRPAATCGVYKTRVYGTRQLSDCVDTIRKSILLLVVPQEF